MFLHYPHPNHKVRKVISLLLGVGASVVLVVGESAIAADESLEGQPESQLEEVMVTAQRREQLEWEVPSSISVLGQEEIERENIHSFADYALRVPNLTFDQAGMIGYRGAVDVTIRAVPGRTNYYLDDTPLPVTDVRLFDIDRVEVLRGPQGTLYGDAAMGGTIKIITNKPKLGEFSGAAATSFGVTKDGASSYSADAYVNVPLSERFALRLTGYYEDVGGYIDNVNSADGLGDQSGGFLPFKVNVQKDINGGDRKGVRAAVRFGVTDSLTLDFSAWAQDLELGARSLYDRETPLQTSFRGTMFESQELRVYNGTLNWAADNFDLLSSTTYFTLQTNNSEDITVFLARGLFGFSPDVFTNPQQLNNALPSDGFTHETRLSFNGNFGEMPVFAIAGVFYEDSETSRDQYWYDQQSISDINSAIDPTGEIGFDFGNQFDALGIERGLWGYQQLPNRMKQLALFSEVSINPIDWLELTAGLRWFDFDVKETRTTDGFLFGGFENQSGQTSDSGVVPRFNVKANVNEDTIVYTSATKGFNIGSALGSALPAICQPALDELGLTDGPLKPETLWSYELGTKGRYLDGRLSMTAAAFYIDWKDIQESVTFPDNSCPESLEGNFGDAKIKGAEFSFQAMIIDGLEVGGSIGYSDAKRSVAPIGTNAGEQVGNQTLTTSMKLQYQFSIGAGMDAYIGGDHQYIEERAPKMFLGTPHYHVTNLRVGVVGQDRWEAVLVARNAFNSDPILLTYAPGSVGNLAQQDATLRPRTVSIELRMRF